MACCFISKLKIFTNTCTCRLQEYEKAKSLYRCIANKKVFVRNAEMLRLKQIFFFSNYASIIILTDF